MHPYSPASIELQCQLLGEGRSREGVSRGKKTTCVIDRKNADSTLQIALPPHPQPAARALSRHCTSVCDRSRVSQLRDRCELDGAAELKITSEKKRIAPTP
jgi:hypothetical protein